MYTGIVQALRPVTRVKRAPGLVTFTVDFTAELLEELVTGASVAVDGVCFTVTTIEGTNVTFDAMQETLDQTTIGAIREGLHVNIERSAKSNAEIGGHVISGHVVDVAEVVEVQASENNKMMRFQGKDPWMRYIFHKGFLALNGASLTVASVDKSLGQFTVYFIPETLQRTNFGVLAAGDKVNVEVDHQTQVIVDTVTNYLAEHADTIGSLASG